MSSQAITPLANGSGVLNIDKPADWTSHDVVARVRTLTGIRRVGHAGTLDPMATGVLVLCLGLATRLIEYVMGQRKVYEAQIRLGVTTDTYDAEGQETATATVPSLTREDLDLALEQFRGHFMQVPPPYSAIKRGGQPLYKLARQGHHVAVEPRPVTVHELQLLEISGPSLHARITCGTGTYVRSIAHDLGQALGCGAHLSALRRLAVGNFLIDDAVTPDELAAAQAEKRWQLLLRPPDTAVQHLDRIVLAHAEANRLAHGQFVPLQAAIAGSDVQQLATGVPVRAYDQDFRLLGIVGLDTDLQVWRPLKVLVHPGP